MKFSQQVAVGTSRERLLEVLADRAAVIRCIPGVAEVTPTDAGFNLNSVVGMGPVKLRFAGEAKVRDGEDGGMVAEVSMHDRLSGSVYGTFDLRPSEGGVEVEADVVLGGRLGEFAVALLRQKAERTVREFGSNLARLAAGGR